MGATVMASLFGTRTATPIGAPSANVAGASVQLPCQPMGPWAKLCSDNLPTFWQQAVLLHAQHHRPALREEPPQLLS
eukprot:802590-Pyramimonas_sp.AAC.1